MHIFTSHSAVALKFVCEIQNVKYILDTTTFCLALTNYFEVITICYITLNCINCRSLPPLPLPLQV